MDPNRNETNRSSSTSNSRLAPMSEFRFSSLIERDIPQIIKIEHDCYTNPWSAESFRQLLRDHATFSTVAIRSGTLLAGYLVYSIVTDELHILNLAISTAFKRKGLATMMLLHLHQLALLHGCQKAFLEVRESNRAAQSLYNKFGYLPISKRKDYYEDNHEDAIVMIADLRKKS